MTSTQNPFAPAVVEGQQGGLILAEQQRGVAEVQARMIIARANPRDQRQAMDAILQDCTRLSLAQGALYEYARGGNEISGPSIRLMETIARRWGNVASGVREVSRRDGYSECVAYAWDLESNYLDERQFQVRHWRDRANGQGYRITDERDIYEMIANVGQRRKRAALQAVIPGDVIEAATEQCELTLHTQADTSPAAVKKLIDAFAEKGITPEQIERRIQRRLQSIRPAQVVQLRKIWVSLRDEMSEPKDWFPDVPPRPSELTPAISDEGTPPVGAESPSQHAGSSDRPLYSITDNNWVVWPLDIEHVEDFLVDTLAAAQKRGAKALEAAIENNEAIPEQLIRDGKTDIGNRLMWELAQRRGILRGILAQQNPKPAEVVDPEPKRAKAQIEAGDAPRSSSETDDGQTRASAEEAGGSPASQPAAPSPNYAVPPVYGRDGKAQPRTWWIGAFLPRLRRAKNLEEYAACISDNGELIQAYYQTLTPAGGIAARKELDDARPVSQ